MSTVTLVDAGFVKVLTWPNLPRHLVALVSDEQAAICRLDTGQVMVFDRRAPKTEGADDGE